MRPKPANALNDARLRRIDEEIVKAYQGRADELLSEVADLIAAQRWRPMSQKRDGDQLHSRKPC